MDESQYNGSSFSFGDVEDTFYENVNQDIQIGKLPYNPFLFDINLQLIKSSQGYQQKGLIIQLSSSITNIIGRKLKKKHISPQSQSSNNKSLQQNNIKQSQVNNKLLQVNNNKLLQVNNNKLSQVNNNKSSQVNNNKSSQVNNKQLLIKSIQQIKHEFLAQTMSKNHFSIDMNHQLSDLDSKKGTYIWIHRNEPKLLQIGDQFLLNQQLIKINSINKTNQKLQLQISQSKTLTLNPKLFKQRLFLIGSSNKCHYINKKLQSYHIGIDLLSLTLHNLIQDQDCDNNIGTWMRIKQPIKIQCGDLILTYPYVFKVNY